MSRCEHGLVHACPRCGRLGDMSDADVGHCVMMCMNADCKVLSYGCRTPRTAYNVARRGGSLDE